MKLIFHEDGSVDGEMLEPIGHLMFIGSSHSDIFSRVVFDEVRSQAERCQNSHNSLEEERPGFAY